MTEPSDEYTLTETDLDLILEDVAGKPVTPESLEADITSLQQRIGQLEKEKTALLGHLEMPGGHPSGAMERQLAALNRQLGATRQRITDFEALLRGRN